MQLLSWIDRIPWAILILGAVFLALAPFPFPPSAQPHLLEKLYLLFQGGLTKPIDIFDLLFHSSLPILLIIRITRRVF